MSTFALIADPHITVPNPDTGWTPPPITTEPTMYAESVELLEVATAEINARSDIDFVLVAGDLTKDSEPYNHQRARELLTRFRAPVYCISGNHDQPRPATLRPPEFLDPTVVPVRADEIPRWYGDFGFKNTKHTYYSCDPAPDLHLVAICSSKPDEDRGYIPPETLAWLDEDLARQRDPQRHTVVMLHHSIIDHVPAESANPMFSWFHVENAAELKAILRQHGVRITLTGHLHMQDVKQEAGLYNIVTASLASYPHAYRIMTVGAGCAEIRSRRLQATRTQPNLQASSYEHTKRVFVPIVTDVLMGQPFHYARDRAEAAARRLNDWWPAISNGDEEFHYTAEQLGDPALAAYVNSFNDPGGVDNDLTIPLE